MGESPEAMHYDEDRVRVLPCTANVGVILIVRKIFYHLAFYIDTPENAAVNGLESSSPSLNAQERLVLHSLIWAFS